jgi:predicted transposase/invertase (TIGR01784 family)
MNVVQFSPDDDIIEIRHDNVFKAIFTKRTPESMGALQRLLSVILGREIISVTIIENEPAPIGLRDRLIRFDIQCKFANGELANIEMTFNSLTFEILRLEYYSCRLFIAQDIRGVDKTYGDLEFTYQISFIADKKVFSDNVFLHRFEYYDKEHGISLGGHSRIIVIELEKLEEVLSKSVSEMSQIERWVLFVAYSTDRTKRAIINEIINKEEGVAMAAQVMLTVSRDEKERAALESEYKAAVDRQSERIVIERRVRKEEREKAESILKEEREKTKTILKEEREKADAVLKEEREKADAKDKEKTNNLIRKMLKTEQNLEYISDFFEIPIATVEAIYKETISNKI